MVSLSNFASTAPSSRADASQVIERIRTEQRREREKTPDGQRTKMDALEQKILQTLDDASHVVPELLQNADDVGGDCRTVTLRLTEDALIVENDGDEMTARQVAALGEFTASTKSDLSYIGHFGIGFKTVFSITNEPRIQSGYFDFKYNEAAPESPVSLTRSSSHTGGTRIRLPFKPDLPETRREAVRDQLEAVHRLLPFLNHLNTVNVELDGETTTYVRSTDDAGNLRVQTPEVDSRDAVDDRYRVFTDSLKTDRKLRNTLAAERGFETADLESRDIELKVSIAVPVTADGEPTTQDDSRLFCYFPTQDETGLPFHVQADFLLKSDREQIRPGHWLNERLLATAGRLIGTAIREFRADELPPRSLLELIPDGLNDHAEYLAPLTETAHETLASKAIVPGIDGTQYAPEDVFIIPNELQDVVDLEAMAASRVDEYAHPDPKLSAQRRAKLRELPATTGLTPSDTLQALRETDLPSERSTESVVSLLGALEAYIDSNLYSFKDEDQAEIEKIREEVRKLPLFSFQGAIEDTERNAIRDAENEVYLPKPQGDAVFEPFYDELTLLSGEMAAELSSPEAVDERTANRARELLLDRLGLSELSHRDVVRNVVNEAFDDTSAYDDAQLDQFVAYINERPGRLADTAAIKLRSTDGEYRPPEDLYIPTAYTEDSFDASLLFGEVTDKQPVTPDYLPANPTTKTRSEWRTTLRELGVQTRVEIPENPEDCQRETFTDTSEFEAFLDAHGGSDTEVRPDADTTPYNGNGCSWMRAADARHALVDYHCSPGVRTRLQAALPNDPQLAVAFSKMLATYWDDYYCDRMYRDYHYSVPNNGYSRRTEQSQCPSSFLEFLRSTPWLPGSDDDVHQPDHLFERNPVTKEAAVTYVADAASGLPEDIFEMMGIQDDVGIEEHVVALKRTAAARENRPVDAVDKDIRKTLHKLSQAVETAPELDAADIRSELSDCPFIYVENASPDFRTLSDVVWANELGNHAVALNEVYRGFKTLFVDTLNVPYEPTLETHLTDFSAANDDPQRTIRRAWREIVREVAHEDDPKISVQEAGNTLAASGVVPSANQTLEPYEDIEYVARRASWIETLPSELARRVALPAFDDTYRNIENAVNRLCTVLNARPLSEVLESTIDHPPYEPTDQVLYDRLAQSLDVGHSVLQHRELPEAATKLRQLAKYTFQEASTIRCKYTLVDAQTITDEVAVAIDSDAQHVLVTSTGGAQLDIIDELAATLELTDGDKSAFTNLVKGALGKPNGLIEPYLEDENVPLGPLRGSFTDEDLTDTTVPEQSETTPPQAATELTRKETPSSSLNDSQSNSIDTDSEIDTEADPGLTGTGSNPLQESNVRGNHSDVITDADITETDFDPRENDWDPSRTDWDPSETGENDGQATSGWMNTPNENKTTRFRTNESVETSTGENGSGGAAAVETGSIGEEAAMEYVRRLVTEEFVAPSVSGESASEYTVSGQIEDAQHTVRITRVPDKEEPHCDILVQGAAFQAPTGTLKVDTIADDASGLLEVKTTDSDSKTFSMTKPEHEDACTNPDSYFVVRLQRHMDGVDVEYTFDSIPTVTTTATQELGVVNYELTFRYK